MKECPVTTQLLVAIDHAVDRLGDINMCVKVEPLPSGYAIARALCDIDEINKKLELLANMMAKA
jgi:hypothetical protein